MALTEEGRDRIVNKILRKVDKEIKLLTADEKIFVMRLMSACLNNQVTAHALNQEETTSVNSSS